MQPMVLLLLHAHHSGRARPCPRASTERDGSVEERHEEKAEESVKTGAELYRRAFSAQLVGQINGGSRRFLCAHVRLDQQPGQIASHDYRWFSPVSARELGIKQASGKLVLLDRLPTPKYIREARQWQSTETLSLEQQATFELRRLPPIRSTAC